MVTRIQHAMSGAISTESIDSTTALSGHDFQVTFSRPILSSLRTQHASPSIVSYTPKIT